RGREVIRAGWPFVFLSDRRGLYGCDGRQKILVEPLPAAGEKGNLISHIGWSFGNREVCRVRTCFEGETVGSDLLPADAFVAERPGVFIDALQLPVRLLLFGTGPEIDPITQLAEALGWTVELSAHHPELLKNFRSDPKPAAVVMNHIFGRDLLSLHRLLPLQLRYIGLLGPKKRHAEILTQLSEYEPFDLNRARNNLFAP